MTAEDDRADAYLLSLARREAAARARAALLRGNPAALVALRERWEPIVAAMKEQERGRHEEASS